MGLFGVFYTMFVLGSKFYKGIVDNIEDTKSREVAVKEGQEVYIGHDNVGHYVKDGKKTMYCYEHLNGYDKKPDYVLKYVGTKEIIRNFSQEDRERTQNESYKEAKEKKYTVYRIGEKYDNHFKDKCRGYRYKDINTGEIYVKRRINGGDYYMSVNTGLLIRKTDLQIEKEKDDAINNPVRHRLNIKRDEEHIMEEFNKQQLERAKKYGVDFRNDLSI